MIDNRARRLVGDVLALGILSALLWQLARGVALVRDLPSGDEATYAATGLRVLAALRARLPPPWASAEWAPLYSASYAALAVLVRDPLRLVDAMWTSLVGGITFALYALARRLGSKPAAALLVAAAPLTTNCFHVDPYPSDLYLLLLLAGIHLALGLRGEIARRLVVLGAFAVAAFARPEACLVLVVGPLACLAGPWALGRGTADRRGWLLGAIAFVPAIGCLAFFGNPLGGIRAFDAFAQHYAFTTGRSEKLPTNMWMAYDVLVHRDFGDAHTVGAALRANPRAFLAHVLFDVKELPGNLLDAASLRREIAAQASAVWQAVSAVVLVIVAVAFFYRLARARQMERGEKLVAYVAALAVVAAAPGVVLVFPRAHYLVAPCVLGWVVAAPWLFDRVSRHTARLVSLARMDVAPLLAGALAWFLVPSASLSVATPHRDTARALRELVLGPAPIFEAAFGVVSFAGYEAPTVPGWSKDQPLDDVLREHGVGAVVLADELLARPAFADDPEVARFLANPAGRGFCLVYVSPGFARIFARPEDIQAEPAKRTCASLVRHPAS